MVRRMIAMMITRGCSTREVSHMARVSERRVQQVCRELELAGLIPVMSRKTARKMRGAELQGFTGKVPHKNGGLKFAGKVPHKNGV